MIETFTARGLLGNPPTTDPRNRRSALTAAAARIAESVRRRTKPTEQGTVGAPWQADAWEAYELVGELAFLTTAIASKVGQARMYPGEVADDPRDPPTLLEDGPVAEAFAALTAAPGWFDAIERLALNLMVAGEGWLVGVPRYLLPPELRSDAGDPDPGSPEPVDPADAAWNGWEPLTEEDPPIPVLGAGFDPADLDWWCQSVEELSLSTSGEVHLQLPSAGVPKRVELASGSVLLVRVWEPHPARAWEAGPATRSALPTLRTLTALAMRDAADLDSRLAGAGLLFVPQSAAQAMQNAVGARFNDTDTPEVADQFTDLLIRAASTAIRDRSSAAALVPIVLPVPDETAALFRHMSFAEPLDSAGTEKQTHAIRRLATQMDSPPELLLGTSSMNHWGSWQVSQETIRSHVEPKLALICRAITTELIAPMLRAQGMTWPDIRRYAIGYDVEHLIVRPNRSGDALELHNRGVISDDAVRDELGFDADDGAEAPDPAVSLVVEMLKKEPTLAQTVGVGSLLETIRELLAGGTPTDTPSATGTGDGERPTGAIPETSEDPAPVGEPA